MTAAVSQRRSDAVFMIFPAVAVAVQKIRRHFIAAVIAELFGLKRPPLNAVLCAEDLRIQYHFCRLSSAVQFITHIIHFMGSMLS